MKTIHVARNNNHCSYRKRSMFLVRTIIVRIIPLLPRYFFVIPLPFPCFRTLNTPLHYGTKSGHFETSKIRFPTSEGVSEVSGASERANGRATDQVLTSLFLFVPDHSALWSRITKNTHCSTGSLARTAHSFACSTLLASLTRSAALARSLTLLTPSLVGKWMIRWLFCLCFFFLFWTKVPWSDYSRFRRHTYMATS